MNYYVVACDRDGVYVMDELCNVTEFEDGEVLLFEYFKHIVGVNGHEIVPGVVIKGSMGDSYYTFVKGLTCGELLHDFMVLENNATLSGNAEMLMKFGVRALVSDTGKLLYLNLRGSQRPFRLSWICHTVGLCSLCAGTYIVDDKIKKMSHIPVLSPSDFAVFKCSEVTRRDLRDDLVAAGKSGVGMLCTLEW